MRLRNLLATERRRVRTMESEILALLDLKVRVSDNTGASLREAARIARKYRGR